MMERVVSCCWRLLTQRAHFHPDGWWLEGGDNRDCELVSSTTWFHVFGQTNGRCFISLCLLHYDLDDLLLDQGSLHHINIIFVGPS